MSYNFNNPPMGTGGPVIRWLVGAVQFLSRRLTAIADGGGGGGGTGSPYLKKQVFTPTVVSIGYIPPAIQAFTVGATLTGDVTGASGTILSADDLTGIITLNNVVGTFDGSDILYTDDTGGSAPADGRPGEYDGDVTIAADTDILYYDPTIGVTAGVAFLPEKPQDGKVIYIYFGGFMNKEGAILAVSFEVQTTDHSVLVPNNHGVKAKIGTPTKVIYRSDITAWYIT